MKKKQKSIGKRKAKKVYCTALICIDNKPIQQKYLKQYRASKTRLKNAEAKYLNFKEIDLINFERWKAQKFGKYETELRKLQAKHTDLASYYDTIQSCIFFEGVSPTEAYEMVKLLRENPEEFRKKYKSDEEKPQDGSVEEEEDFDDESDEFFQGFAKAMFGDGFQFDDGDEPFSESPRHAKEETAENKNFKSKYRELANKLHPDKRPGNVDNPQLLDELWYELQEAYENQDLDDIERIEALCEAEIETINESTYLQVIRKVTEHLKNSLYHLNREIRQIKKSPAWKYTQSKDKKGFERAMKLEFQREIAYFKSEIVEIEEVLEEIKNDTDQEDDDLDMTFQPKPSKKRQNSKKKTKKEPQVDPNQTEFSF